MPRAGSPGSVTQGWGQGRGQDRRCAALWMVTQPWHGAGDRSLLPVGTWHPTRSPPAHLELHAVARVDGDGVGAVQAAIVGDNGRLRGCQPALGSRQRPVAGGWRHRRPWLSPAAPQPHPWLLPQRSPGPCRVVTVVVVMVEVVVVPSSSPGTAAALAPGPKDVLGVAGAWLGDVGPGTGTPVGDHEGSAPGTVPHASPHGPERPAGVVSGSVGKAARGRAGVRGGGSGAGGPGAGWRTPAGRRGPGPAGRNGAWPR